jgi:hypothetical protein
MFRTLGITLLCLSINSCTTTDDQDHAAVCKELKHRIIFNGATGNDTKATQQRAELGTLTHDYHDQGC